MKFLFSQQNQSILWILLILSHSFSANSEIDEKIRLLEYELCSERGSVYALRKLIAYYSRVGKSPFEIRRHLNEYMAKKENFDIDQKDLIWDFYHDYGDRFQVIPRQLPRTYYQRILQLEGKMYIRFHRNHWKIFDSETAEQKDHFDLEDRTRNAIDVSPSTFAYSDGVVVRIHRLDGRQIPNKDDPATYYRTLDKKKGFVFMKNGRVLLTNKAYEIGEEVKLLQDDLEFKGLLGKVDETRFIELHRETMKIYSLDDLANPQTTPFPEPLPSYRKEVKLLENDILLLDLDSHLMTEKEIVLASFDLKTNKEIAKVSRGHGELIKTFPGGKRFQIIDRDNILSIWDAQTGKERPIDLFKNSSDKKERTQYIKYSQDGKKAFIYRMEGSSGPLYLWDLESNTYELLVPTISHSKGRRDFRFSEDGKYLIKMNQKEKTISLHPLENTKITYRTFQSKYSLEFAQAKISGDYGHFFVFFNPDIYHQDRRPMEIFNFKSQEFIQEFSAENGPLILSPRKDFLIQKSDAGDRLIQYRGR